LCDPLTYELRKLEPNTNMHVTQLFSAIAFSILFSSPLFGSESPSTSPLRETTEDEVPLAVDALDVTTYFDDKGPVEGNSAITVEWNNKRWHFVSEANRRQFVENPMRYAPRFGGYCCQSLSEGKLVKGDPRVFRIVDDRLYLFHDLDRKRIWTEDLPESRVRSTVNYLRLFSVDF